LIGLSSTVNQDARR